MLAEHYSSHYLRIETATIAAQQGLSFSALKDLGHVSSDTYQTYIRPKLFDLKKNHTHNLNHTLQGPG